MARFLHADVLIESVTSHPLAHAAVRRQAVREPAGIGARVTYI